MTKRVYQLKELGFNKELNEYRIANGLDSFLLGRIILEHKERYEVITEQGEMDCELIGNLRFTAESRADLPAVGDWVAIQEYDFKKGLIHIVYPRKNLLERQATGKSGEKQIIASNIDYAFIVQSTNRDFSVNRIERYITICNSSGIEPIIILNKIDLISEEVLSEMLHSIRTRINGVDVFAISNFSGEGLTALKDQIVAGKTYCLLGSSGVGKSSLINSLSKDSLMKTGAISESIDRGKHITTHRELIVLDSGGIIIDNPGMREVGITENADGLAMTFDQIYELAQHCKFNDCSHQSEKDCAVLAALDKGELDEASYENFMKLIREQAHFAASLHEKRKKDKAFGKMVKAVMNQKRKHKG